jgi:hypothetical protein
LGPSERKKKECSRPVQSVVELVPLPGVRVWPDERVQRLYQSCPGGIQFRQLVCHGTTFGDFRAGPGEPFNQCPELV